MGKETLYCIANLDEGWIVKDLTAAEARAIFGTLTPKKRFRTRIWTEAWGQWKHLDVPEATFLFEARKETQKPPAPNWQEPVEITQVMSPQPPRRLSNAESPRRHDRYKVSIPVRIQNSYYHFDTVTEDVSEGGLRLKDPLPDLFAGYCQIVFHPNSDLSFVILANLVEDQRNARIHLEFVDTDEQWKFIDWLRAQSWAKPA